MPTASNAPHDALGNPVTGPAEAIALYDRAVDRFLRFHPDVVDLGGSLAVEHPSFAMGQALLAYLHLTSTDAPDVAVARQAHAAMVATAANEREALHAEAVGAWSSGDWLGAARALDDVLVRWPADLLALMIGHQLDFFLGDAGNLRDRPARVLPELDPAHPLTGFVRGMHAFGLEESGHYGESEQAGLAALETNTDDVWAIHAVVHTYEMQGRIDDGLRFLRARVDDWGSGNLFTVHNWWHLALYLLEAGDVAPVLDIYDRHVHNEQSAGVPIEMLDASALLWRLFLEGVDVSDRAGVLAGAWDTRSSATSWYVFNDLHATMAFAAAGRLADARALVDRLALYIGSGAAGTNVRMVSEIGLPVCRAVLAYSEGRYDDVVSLLLPIRRSFHHFGGSHAQRDALARTLLEAAVRAGRFELARALTAERLSARGTSVYGWSRRAEVLGASPAMPSVRPRPRPEPKLPPGPVRLGVS